MSVYSPRWIPNKRRDSPTPDPKHACQNWSVCCIPTESNLYRKQTGNVTKALLGLAPGSSHPDPPTSQVQEFCTNFICKNQAERGTEKSPRPSGPCNNLSLPEKHQARPTQLSPLTPRPHSKPTKPHPSTAVCSLWFTPLPGPGPAPEGWDRRGWATQWRTGRCRATDRGIACRTTCRWLRRTGRRSSRLCRRRVAW